MSSVDNRVVHLQFDNKQFESGAKQSLSTLEKLKSKLNFKDAVSSLVDLSKKVNSFSASGMNSALQTVEQRFNTLGIVGMTVIQNLTTAAMNMASQFTKAVTIQPIIDGFNEYETQINAVQTILANTQKEGTNIDTVNAALDTLNTYADKTIYNFTEMTRNIGTFTAAGVDLQTSVDSIQGIANLAAVSGSSSMQASTAMYQLSQAMAAGTVKLMDWNSVVNAGMGGQVFQDALVRTSEHLQTGAKAAIEAEGSFRESLSTGWLTVDVLTETLKQFSLNVETAEDYENAMADLVAQGYTEEEAKNIVDMARTANEAATKVKTFTQLIDTLKEALGSGWTQSWRIVIGDFEEAKELYTEISDVLSAMINDSATARNNMLQSWSDMGGRQAVIESLRNAFEALMQVVTAISSGIREVFPSMTADRLMDLTNKLKSFTEGLKLSEDDINKLKTVVTDLCTVLKFVGTVVGTVISDFASLVGATKALDNGFIGLVYNVEQFLKKIAQSSEVQGLINAIKNLYNVVKNFANSIATALDFTTIFGDGATEAAEGASLLSSVLATLFNVAGSLASVLASGLTGALNAVSNLMTSLGTVAQGITTIFMRIIGIIPETIGTAISAVGTAVNSILDAIPVERVLDIVNKVLFSIVLNNINKFVSNANKAKENTVGIVGQVQKIIETFGDTIGKFGDVLDKAKDAISTFIASIKVNMLLKIAIALGVLAAAMYLLASLPIENIVTALGALGATFIVIAGATAGVLAFMKKFTTSLSDLMKLTSLANNLKTVAVSVLLLAVAFRVMASAIEAVASLSVEQLAIGIAGIAASIAALVIAVNLLQNQKGILKTAASLIVFSAAIAILAAAIKSFAGLSIGDIAVGITAVAASTAVLVAATMLLNTQSKGVLKTSVLIATLAVSMMLLGKAVQAFASVDISAVGTASLAMVALVAAVKVMSSSVKLTNAVQMLMLIGVIAVYSVALRSLADTIVKFNDINDGSVAKASAAIVMFMTSIIAMTTAIKLLKIEQSMYDLAAVIGTIALAIGTYADAVQKLGSMKISDIAKGTVAMAAGLAILFETIRLLPEEMSLKTSASFAVVTASLIVLANAISKLGQLSITQLATALVGLAAGMAAMVVGMKALSKSGASDALKSAAALLVFALALSALAAAVQTMGNMDAVNMAQGLIGLAAAIAIIVVGCKALESVSKSIKKSAANLVIMSAAIVVLGIALTAVMTPISQMTDIGGENAVATLTGVLVFIASLVALTEALNRLPSLSAKTLVTVGFMAAVIAGVAAVVTQLASLNPQGALAGATALAEVMVATSAALAIVSMVPVTGALKAVGTMGIIIAGISAIVLAMGGLSQIPGATWLVNEGKNFLQSIGEAIGSFFGGIVGGVVGGAMSSIANQLPGIGSSLTEFADNASGFFTAMQNVDPNIGSCIANLAAAMVLITGADILNAATSWLTGGSSMVEFGKQLAEFAPYLMEFSVYAEYINADAVNGAANAAKTLAEFANNLPKDGGLLQQIVGSVDLVGFGQKLAEFGPYLAQYASSVGDIDADVVESSANAAKALAEMATSLPAQGGWAQTILGSQDIAEFGSKIVQFGTSMLAYYVAVKPIDAGVVEASANAGKALAELANSLPAQGGWAQTILGSQDLGTFGTQLITFGTAMLGYYMAVKPIDAGVVEASANAGKALAELANAVPTSGGILEWITGGQDFKSFSSNMKYIGTGLKSYYEETQDVAAGTVRSSASALETLISAMQTVEGTGFLDALTNGARDYTTVASGMGGLGQGLKAYADAIGSEFKPDVVTNSTGALTNLIQAMQNVESSGGLNMLFEGNKDYGQLKNGMQQVGEGLKAFYDSVVDVAYGKLTGVSEALVTLTNAMSQMQNLDPEKIKNVAEAIKNLGDMNLPGLNEAMGTAATEVGAKIAELSANIAANAPGLQDALNSLNDCINNAKDAMSSAATNLGDSVMNAMRDAFTNGGSGVNDAMNNVTNEVINTGETNLNNGQDKFKTAGTDLMNAVRDGVNSQYQIVVQTIKNVATSVENAFNVSNSGYYQAGVYLMQGLENGIKDGRSGVINAAVKVATETLKATKEALDEASPSKATTEMGVFYSQGLLNGIVSLEDKVADAGTDVGLAALNALDDSFSAINSGAYSGLQPMITPVISGSGLASLQGLTVSRSVMLNAEYANAQISDPLNNLRTSISEDNIKLMRSNASVTQAINDLRTDMGSYSEAIANSETSMYIDGKKLASTIAKPINQQLGLLQRRGY